MVTFLEERDKFMPVAGGVTIDPPPSAGIEVATARTPAPGLAAAGFAVSRR